MFSFFLSLCIRRAPRRFLFSWVFSFGFVGFCSLKFWYVRCFLFCLVVFGMC